MTHRTKGILIRSLKDYKDATTYQKSILKKMVIDNLDRNEKGLHTIGMGLDCDMVQAGKIFLRITK